MWAEYLTSSLQGDLFLTPYPFLTFDWLEEFEINVGINDSYWLGNEDVDSSTLLEDILNDLPLFKSNS